VVDPAAVTAEETAANAVAGANTAANSAGIQRQTFGRGLFTIPRFSF